MKIFVVKLEGYYHVHRVFVKRWWGDEEIMTANKETCIDYAKRCIEAGKLLDDTVVFEGEINGA